MRCVPRPCRPVLAFALFLFLSADPLHAMCVVSGPACAEFWQAKVVFDGIVEGWEEAERPHVDSRGIPARLVTFRVEHAWKGVADGARTVKVVTFGGRGMWVEDQWEFVKGRRYLVWAYPTYRPDELTTSRCGLTKEIEGAGDDLAFLRSLSQPASGGWVSGQVAHSENSLRPDAPWSTRPLPGVKVRIEGGGAGREVVTDASGRYEARGLAAGTYQVSARVPEPLTVPYEPLRTVEIADRRGCAVADFRAVTDGAIGGVVLGTDGLPVDGVQLEAVLADVFDAAPRSLPALSARTDASGRFAFTEVPAGRYLVGVNLRMGPRTSSPWPLALLPGTAARDQATTVELTAGQHVDAGIFRLPPRLGTVAVHGQVVWPDGRPAAAQVTPSCNHLGRYSSADATTSDERGLFTLNVFEGSACTLRAFVVDSDSRIVSQASGGPLVATRGGMPPLRLVLGAPVRRETAR